MTSGPALPPPGWHGDPDPAAPPGRLRYWDGRGWTEHVSSPQPPPPPPPPPTWGPASPGNVPIPAPTRQPSGCGPMALLVGVLGAVTIAVIAFAVSVTGNGTTAPPPPTFAAADTAHPVAFDRLFVAPPAGFALRGSTTDVLPPELAGRTDSSRARVLAAVVHDGYVAGARRVYVSADGREDVTVSIVQMASARGATAFAPVLMQPYLDERGWAFGAPVPSGIGAAGLQQVIPDPSGRYALVAVAPAKRYVVIVEVRSPDQRALVTPLFESLRAQWVALGT